MYFRDVGSSSGTFLNRLRLSPSGKESRPYPLKAGDIIQLGVDYQGRQEEIYKCVTIKLFVSDCNGSKIKPKNARMKTAISHLIAAMNPNNDAVNEEMVSCCICLSDMEPFQALFLAPCSHCFHYKCCTPLLASGFMFQCPLCRQVANLEADVAQEFESDDEELEDEVLAETDSAPIAILNDPNTANILSNLVTPPNRSSFPDPIYTESLSSVSLVGQEMESSRAQQVLFDYESAMTRLCAVFPGLADEGWRDRLKNVQESLSEQ